MCIVVRKEILKMNQSELLNIVRFPLVFLVIVGHVLSFEMVPVTLDLNENHIYYFVSELFSHGLGWSRNPLFFTLSGYLFFATNRQFTWIDYQEKIKRRWFSLVLPYILWNTIAVFAETIRKVLLQVSGRGEFNWVHCFSWEELRNLYWIVPGDYPLWFVRDLICVSLISPLLYWVVRKGGGWVVSLLFLLYVLEVNTGVVGFSIGALTFFSMGIYLAIYRRRESRDEILFLCNKYGCRACLVWLALCCGFVVLNQESWAFYIIRLSAPMGIIAYFYIIRALALRIPRFRILMLRLVPTVFFVFALHLIQIEGLLKGAFSRIELFQTGWYQFIPYIAIPILTSLICISIYYLLKHFLPQFLKILTGSRVNRKVYTSTSVLS